MVQTLHVFRCEDKLMCCVELQMIQDAVYFRVSINKPETKRTNKLTLLKFIQRFTKQNF